MESCSTHYHLGNFCHGTYGIGRLPLRPCARNLNLMPEMSESQKYPIPPSEGIEVEISASFSQEQLAEFASLSLDDNPLHLNEEYAVKAGFGRPVVHGVLLLGLFSRIFGNLYPGRGSVYLSQSARFLRPAYVNEQLRAQVRLESIDTGSSTEIFLTECFNEKGKRILSGRAEILFPDRYFPDSKPEAKRNPLFSGRNV